MEAYKYHDPDAYQAVLDSIQCPPSSSSSSSSSQSLSAGDTKLIRANTTRPNTSSPNTSSPNTTSPIQRALLYDLAVHIARSTIGKTSAEAVDLFVAAVKKFGLDWPEQVHLLSEHRRVAPLVEKQVARAFDAQLGTQLGTKLGTRQQTKLETKLEMQVRRAKNMRFLQHSRRANSGHANSGRTIQKRPFDSRFRNARQKQKSRRSPRTFFQQHFLL